MAFDFSKFKIPGLFAQKVNPQVEAQLDDDQVEKISYRRYGFIQAGTMHGRTEGLRVCLDAVYENHMAEMRRNEKKQEELRKPHRENLQDLLGINEGLKSQIARCETEIIPSRLAKIESIRNEIIDIKKHPEHYPGVHISKAGYFIGVAILCLLSIYLFIFYSSASYSAFFKEFKVEDIVITKAIFDANAIGNALNDGLTELIFILTIPFVFIGLGYLIHKFQESKGYGKYFKIAALLVVTFIFDAIIAYEITEKIYEIKRTDDLGGNLPSYSFRLAFGNVGFWLVIFAGFVVYLIWGFVFDFVMDSHSKLDAVKVHINIKRDQIQGLEREIGELERKVVEMKGELDKNNGEINKLKHIIEGTIIQPKEVKEALSQFMLGWYGWLSEGREYNRSEHKKIYEEFIATKVTVFESVINSN